MLLETQTPSHQDRPVTQSVHQCINYIKDRQLPGGLWQSPGPLAHQLPRGETEQGSELRDEPRIKTLGVTVTELVTLMYASRLL